MGEERCSVCLLGLNLFFAKQKFDNLGNTLIRFQAV